MGSRGEVMEARGNGYYIWSGVSGVPGLGNSLRQLHKRRPNPEKYQGIPKANLRSKSYHGNTCSNFSSLVLPRLSCHNCGYRGGHTFPDSLSSGDVFPESISNYDGSYESISSASADSIDSMLEKCLQAKSKQNPMQQLRSLNSLPNPHKLSAPSINPDKYATPSIKPKHKKLERVTGAKVLRPHVTFSEFTENINVIVDEHKKLSRKENILRVNQHPKSILVGDDRPTSVTPEIHTQEYIESETESESHYKTINGVEDDYSYAYRDAFSPALMIKQEADNFSESSEDIYEVVEHHENNDETKPKARSVSDQNDLENPFFHSISKGRRNHLKLHRFVDWDLDSDFFPGAGEDLSEELQEEDKDDTKVNAKVVNISKGIKPLFNASEVDYFEYKNYKNVRSRKFKKVLRSDKSHLKARGQEKDHLKTKQSISKKMSSISFFAQNKESRSNFRKTLRKTLSSMVVSMMNIF